MPISPKVYSLQREICGDQDVSFLTSPWPKSKHGAVISNPGKDRFRGAGALARAAASARLRPSANSRDQRFFRHRHSANTIMDTTLEVFAYRGQIKFDLGRTICNIDTVPQVHMEVIVCREVTRPR